MGEFIRTERDGHVLIVTLDRPKVLNSLHAPACFELDRIWTDFQADPDLWVAIICGEGRSFCAGHDLVDNPHDPMPASGWAGMAERNDLTKPIIAAVQGHVMGGGFEIALACDLIIADETAKFALSEPKVGAVALGGGVARLMTRIPASIAMGLVLTARTMGAAEADRHGLLTELVPAGEALNAAKRWAAEILTCAPFAVAQSKRIAREILEGPNMTADIHRHHAEIHPLLETSEDTKEGIAAFIEKRAPVWTGR